MSNPKEIPLSQGLVTLVDAEDYDWLTQWKWHTRVIRGKFYAQRNLPRYASRRGHALLHRVILDPADSRVLVDHINGDGLDNRRVNLRPATNAENLHNRGTQKNNTSGFKGVGYDRVNRRWRAEIANEGRRLFLGRFASAEEAARAYDMAARELHGEFAWTNFPLDPNYQGEQ